ncbi:hypothetical protein ACWEVD_19350 [Nocardia thailandica]
MMRTLNCAAIVLSALVIGAGPALAAPSESGQPVAVNAPVVETGSTSQSLADTLLTPVWILLRMTGSSELADAVKPPRCPLLCG